MLQKAPLKQTRLEWATCRARYYDPGLGRFLSEDSLRWSGDGSDFFTYVLNNPVRYIDPSGKKINVEKGDVQEWLKAKEYLKNAPNMAAMIAKMDESSTVYNITIMSPSNCEEWSNTWGGARSNTDDNAILWYPNCAWRCGSGNCTISPALILGHELAHLFHDKKERNERSYGVPGFGNAEEQYTITGTENNAAIYLHECVRTDHKSGQLYNVSSPSQR